MRNDESAGIPAEQSTSLRLHLMATEYYQLVWRTLRRLGLLPHDADDACQQVFVVAAGRIHDILPGCERSFLFQTALRMVMTSRRTRAQRREDFGTEGIPEREDNAPLPDEAIEQNVYRECLQQALESIPMELRTAFVLYELERMSQPEIASLLGVPVGTVASRLRRGREQFQQAIRRMRSKIERGGSS